MLLLGPRQTGKSTLLQPLQPDLMFNFLRPEVRQRYERAPQLLGAEVEALGAIFEQFVGLELLHAIRQAKDSVGLRFWRDPDGPEVDWVVVTEDRWLPVEVKWSDRPTERDTRHLQIFLSEYSKATTAVVVCRTPRRFNITPKIIAVPWQEISRLVEELA